MKRSFSALALGLALGIFGCSGGDDNPPTTNADLITIDAPAGAIELVGTAPNGAARYELILAQVSQVTVGLADRPVRSAHTMALRDLVDQWDANGWTNQPPAALLTVRDDAAGVWIEAFFLSNPRLVNSELRLTADGADGSTQLPAAFLDADLFIEAPSAPDNPGRIFSLPSNNGSITRNPENGGPASYTLTLDEVSPLAAYLWNGEPPVGGPIDTATFIASWASYGFDEVPPNASITTRSGLDTETAVVTLTDPVYDPDEATLRFTAHDVGGTASLPATFAEGDVFIDTAAGGGRSSAFDKVIGVDYDFEARCSDDNWSTNNPPACNPQPSFMCPPDGLALCPPRCQACFDADLNQMKGLGIGAITIYNPNWYALTAAQKVGMKVLLGTFNDTLAGLARPDAPSGCTYSGGATACGATYARYVLDGACGSTSPWDPNQFCQSGTFITPWKPFLADGTAVGIQIGNEVLANGFTKQQILDAAKTLRGVLDSRGYTNDKVPIVISLVLGQENGFCSGGSPPANVDFVAAHPYCNSVAGLPPTWPASGTACLDQVKRDYVNISQAACGAANVFIGETGYNTGCPNVYGTQHVADAKTFVDGVTRWACENSYGLFHFAYVDACPMGGCLAGCPSQPSEGNGYFGLYYTQGYLTKGPLVPKLSPMPSLTCP